jgi:hypothetical protein
MFDNGDPLKTNVMDGITRYHLTQALGYIEEQINQVLDGVSWYDGGVSEIWTPQRMVKAFRNRAGIERDGWIPLHTVDAVMAIAALLGHWARPNDTEEKFVDDWGVEYKTEYLPRYIDPGELEPDEQKS